MAELADDVPYTDAATAISQGKRLLLVRDYTAAVTALAEGLELLSRKYGEFGDELGEPYLLYGRALLGLARSESSVLGNGVLGSEETENDDDEDDDDEEDDDDKDENDDDDGCDNNDVTGDVSNNVNNKEKKSTDTATENASSDQKSNEDSVSINNVDNIPTETTSENGDTTNLHQKSTTELENNVPGSSKETLESNATSSQINQDDKNCTENQENEDENIEDDEDEPSRGIDLQVAWEVLELAKNIFLKRGPTGYKHLAETYRLLGEVAMESGNYEVAASEFKQAIGFLENLKPYEFRAIADLHYQLGLVHSSIHEFDISVEQFYKAINLLQSRIKQLEAIQGTPNVPPSDDPFYSIEGEIAELKELLPEIQEKITDAKDFKQEACQRLIDEIKKGVNHANDTNSHSSSSTSKIVKPTSDISHLVRKKRKAKESDIQNTSPCKKTS
ncbi:nuclear autoantigenic sperm protein [Chelonus insularis]|uniref:nuclear autoantigenic sperm protein n=1 Tax=Chelonus insularis TaxID=460826 RepID=UPI00158C521E|nr:nuclear autoantigenic sperm protein [Chelonus insularis]XP_034933880.1 nuclear autoantigenic sperm protein [Chelonus insularis]XP_034933881.1 nuclear autoantigenic sperm protein [Chelonus insularis]